MAEARAHLLDSLPAQAGFAARPARRRRVRAVSLLLSGAFHVALLMAAAAIVWRTAVGTGLSASSVGITFENPGDSPLSSGGPPSTAAPTSNRAERTTTAASLEPMLQPSGPETTLSGLATSSTPAAAAPSLGGLVGSSLASGSLFSPAPGAGGGSAVAGVTDGAPSVTFGGLGASSVGSVVYVVDCSGPMVTSLPMVIAELERSVGRLSASQRFGVVLFRRAADTGPGAESFAPVLVRATPSAKQLLHDWLAAVEPSGRSSPLAGLELALSLKPDAVFLLSRSIQRSGGGVWELGLEPTMDRLEQLNPVTRGLAGPRRPILIQTIQFLEEDPSGIMQAIGQRHGGGAGYRVVRRQQDLQSDSGRGIRTLDPTAAVSDR